jgi:G3E family GTPase
MAMPLTVIGGFLGAGKTTLLKHLLVNAGGRRLAVLVNDFGAINIDAALVRAAGADSIELSNGCVCCSLGDDLVAQLVALEKSAQKFDHVVIEASGVGDPWKIAQIGMVAGGYRLDSVIVVIDTETIAERLKDELMADSVVRQVARADILVANKSDIASAKQRLQARELLAPHVYNLHCQWVECSHSQISIDVALGNFSTTRRTSTRREFVKSYSPKMTPITFTTASFTLESFIDKNQAKALFDSVPREVWSSVFRGKATFCNALGWTQWHKVGARENWLEHDEILGGPSQLVLIGTAINSDIFNKLIKVGWQQVE